MTEPRTPETLYEVERSGVRLDKFLAEASGCGRRTARALIRAGRVRIDGRHATAAMRLVSGQRIEVINDSTPAPDCRDRREAAPRIIDEGAGWLAIAKPAGMHSVTGASGNSVADWLYQRQPETTAVAVSDGDAGLVNRLDRDTSGVLLAARDRATWQALREAFAGHRVEKQYLALVTGRLTAPVTVDQPLARRKSRVRPPRRGEKSYAARTTFHPLETAGHWSLVLATMHTGVTHQIRAHAALAGMAILGDLKYGELCGPQQGRDGHLLHALRIVVPGTLDVTAPIDDDFTRALSALRGE
jgi:23S rRNA pseudouridine1911/1915/1917 synthase